MASQLHPPLRSRNGVGLRVLSVERISTSQQDQRSLDDQQNKSQLFVGQYYDGPIDWRAISGQGSGERLDRHEMVQIEEEIETGSYDLVIVEDLGRICRRVDAYKICELCEDYDTRLIAINDYVDTDQDSWRLNAFFSVLHHEIHNRDTAARIRRTLRNRFAQGGVVQTVIYGYIKPQGTQSDADLRKDARAEEVYARWFAMLEDGASFSEISDWLNDEGVPLGPYCRSARWTPQVVARLTRNPILKGVRVRNTRMSKRVNKTGRRKSVKAPASERLVRLCPHLAFIQPERYDRIIRMLDQKNAKYRRGKQQARDARDGVPRKKTIWPGQSITCGVCGGMLYYGAHGRRDHLLCSGAIQYCCWNAVGISGPGTSERICRAVWAEIEQLPEFDATLLDQYRRQLEQQQGALKNHRQMISKNLDRLAREQQHLLRAIREGRAAKVLLEDLERVTGERQDLQAELERVRQPVGEEPALPSMEQIRRRAAKIFGESPREAPEFGRLMNRLLQNLRVVPYRLRDGGHVVLRAEFTLLLTPLATKSAQEADMVPDLFLRHMVVDLFDPPQRVKHLADIMRLTVNDDAAERNLTERQIAAHLSITQPVVQRAKKLARMLERDGVKDPYVRLTAPPENDTKLKRHKHSRYRLEPQNRQ